MTKPKFVHQPHCECTSCVNPLMGISHEIRNEPKREQLRPCPFCGKLLRKVDPGFYECPASRCDIGFSTRKWNSAYCWKQIDQHKETIKILVDALKEAKIAFDWMLETEPRVAIPNNANETVDEALAKVVDK